MRGQQFLKDLTHMNCSVTFAYVIRCCSELQKKNVSAHSVACRQYNNVPPCSVTMFMSRYLSVLASTLLEFIFLSFNSKIQQDMNLLFVFYAWFFGQDNGSRHA